MKLKIFILLIIFLIPSVLGVQTCILNGTTSNESQCFDTNMDIYETGITFYEGLNDRYGLYIVNPTLDGFQGIIQGAEKFLKTETSLNILTPAMFTDETILTFNTVEDFNNLLQQKNAECNVSLFSQSDLYSKERTLTKSYTSEVINWSYLLIILIIEFTKIFIDILLILVTIFIIFRGIPMGLNFIKKMTIKFYVWSNK